MQWCLIVRERRHVVQPEYMQDDHPFSGSGEAMKAIDRIVGSRRSIQLAVFVSLFIGMAGANSSDTLLIHDVPFFHNDDGLGLLQDCKL